VHRDKLLECLRRLGLREGHMLEALASMYWQAPMTVKNGGAWTRLSVAHIRL
jgi:hypothetical protein